MQYGLPLAEVVPLFAALLSLPLPADYPPLTLSPEQQKQKTLDALLAMLLRSAAQQPVLFVVEDLHWVDPSTLELLSLLVEQGPTARILTLLTCRPGFQPALDAARSHLTQLTLNRLPRRQAVEVIAPGGGRQGAARRGGRADRGQDGWGAAVCGRADQDGAGVGPAAGAGGALCADRAAAPAGDSRHPARLAHGAAGSPGDGRRAVAQLGATLGREFSYELLQAVAPWDEATLQQGLAQLVEAELLYQRGLPPQATYMFKHALIQDAAYQSLLRSTRQQYHQRIAQVLESTFPETVETQPELVAQHYTAAGCAEQAVPYWQRAGQQASDRSAHLEAISHFTTGIELLKTLPETPEHTQQALTLHIALGAALQMAKGHAAPEVEHAYTQARALCQQVGETPELVPVLFGLWRFYLARSQLHTARELGETLLRLAQRAHDPALAVVAHYALGVTWFCLGALPAARQHLEEGIARYTPDQRRAPVFRMGQDPGVACRVYAAVTLWLLGYPEQALARLHEALALAHELSHPYSLAFARCWAAYRLAVSPGRAGRARARRGRRRALDRAGLSTLGGPGNELAWVGAGHAGPGRGGDGPGPPGDRRLAGHRGSAVRPILVHRAGGSLLPTWATRKTASRRWPRPTPWWSSMRNAGGKRKSIASGASCSCGSRGRRRRRRKPGCSGPWTSPAARRRNRWSCGPP